MLPLIGFLASVFATILLYWLIRLYLRTFRYIWRENQRLADEAMRKYRKEHYGWD